MPCFPMLVPADCGDGSGFYKIKENLQMGKFDDCIFQFLFPETVSCTANHSDIKNGDAVESNRTPFYRER